MIRAAMVARSAGPFAALCMLAALVLLGTYSYGRAAGKTACTAHFSAELAKRDLRDAQAVAEQVAAAKQQWDMAAAIERRHLQEQLQREQQRQAAAKQVRDYVQARPKLADCAVDGDGLRLWNAANTGRATARRATPAGQRSGGTDATVRAPAARP